MSESAGATAPLRVVAIATTFPGSLGDGTPEFVLTFSAALQQSDVCVVAPRVRGGALRERIRGVEIRRVAYARRSSERLADDAILPALRSRPTLARQLPRLLWGLYRELRRAVDELRPDVVHAHWIVPGGLLARVVARRRGIPYVVTAHGADAYALNGRIGRRVKRWVLDGAAGIYPVSTEIGEQLAAQAPAAPVRPAIAMGVDIAELVAAAPAAPPTEGSVVFVGRLSDKKGVDVLLRATARTDAVRRLNIVGDGPDRRALEDLARSLGITDRVVFAGHADKALVLQSYMDASVVALPSVTGAGGDRDGVPVVLMEALALGRPVVASALGGLAEHLDPTVAALVEPGDVEGLAAALDQLLTDAAARDALAAAGRERAAERFGALGQARRFELDVAERVASATSRR